MSKELSFETVLNCVALSKPAPIGMELTSELLGCSVVLTHRDSTFGSDLVSHCFHAFQSNDDRTADLRHFLIVVLHAIFANDEKSVGPSPGAMFDLWSSVARNVTDTMRVEFCIRLEYILSALFKVDEGNGAWVVYQRICKLSPTKFAEIWLNVQLQKGESKYESECSLLRSVLEYDCSQFSCLLSMFARIGSDYKMTTLWDSGSLDTITAAFVVQTNKQKDAKSIIANASFAEIAPTICSRFMALLSNKVSECKMLAKLNYCSLV